MWFVLSVLAIIIHTTAGLLDFHTDIDCPWAVIPEIFYSGLYVPKGSPGRAKFTVPQAFSLHKSLIPGAGLGVISKVFLNKFTWLGEYEGVFTPVDYYKDLSHNQRYAWTIHHDRVKFLVEPLRHHVDGLNETTSNWCRYVNCARHSVEMNVKALQCHGRKYYITSRYIVPGEELLTYYGRSHAHVLGIDDDEFYNKRFWYYAKRQSQEEKWKNEFDDLFVKDKKEKELRNLIDYIESKMQESSNGVLESAETYLDEEN